MERTQSKHVYRFVIGALVLVALVVLIITGVVLVASLPPSPEVIAATLTAMPAPTPTWTPVATPVPTLAGISDELLVCQREAGKSMNARSMVGAVTISGDHMMLLSWFSTDWAVRDLDDALSGVIMGFDVALELWDRGCAVYDRVQIDVYDGPRDKQTYRLTVQAPMDDLLRWHAGEFDDRELIARLQVIRPAP